MFQYIKKIIANPKKYFSSAKTFKRYLKIAVEKATPKIAVVESVREKLHYRHSVAFYKNLIGNGEKLVFDVGAHLGRKTEFFRAIGARVVAVEPQADMAAYIRVKFSTDKYVMVEQFGLGETDGEAIIHISSRYPGFSSFHKDWQKGTKYNSFDKSEKVRVTTLEHLIKKYGMPDFCKIDVEGSEPQIFSGLKSKIPILNFEFHSDDPALVKTCLEKLTRIGFTEFNFVMEENTKFAEKKWVRAKELWPKIKAMETKIGKIAWGDIYAK